jgi:choloylglycine hydrolase
MIQQLNTSNTTKPINDYAFDILGKVSQGDFTKWSIVYDITNKTILFRTDRFKQIKTVNFSAFDFNCTATSKVWDMNQTATGSINSLFVNFNNAINKRIVETAVKESENKISISEKNRETLWQYASKIKCQ